MHILGVGNATLDLINLVDRYPQEDEEVRARQQWRRRGGNCANSLQVLCQLGHQCEWLGTLAGDADAQWILQELSRQGVDSPWCPRHTGVTPVSYVALSAANGSRTIIHYRDLPELDPAAFAAIDLTAYQWIHWEGRVPEALRSMLEDARRRSPARRSLEVEKPRSGIEQLLDRVELVLFSRHFATAVGYAGPQQLLRDMVPGGVEAYCTWGDAGAWAVDSQGQSFHAPAYAPARVIDTIGAGDTFNAAVIHGRGQGWPVAQALDYACRLAGRKCGQHGLEQLL